MTGKEKDHEDMSGFSKRQYATDESSREVAGLLFGDGADELISKLSDQRKRKATAGLSAIGAAAGGLGLAVGAKEVHAHGWKKTPKLTRALLPAEVVGLGGELMATKILHGDTKQPKKIAKSEPGSSDVHLSTGSLKRIAAKKAYQETKPLATKAGRGALKALDGVSTKGKVKKSAGFTFEGEFSKVDADKRQVFGWASIVELNGEPIVDLQGDYIDIDEIEKSAYDYVIKSRKGGEMHRRNDDDTPVHASDMIESFLVTPEKIEKMGLPKSTPIGWWVGYQVNDDEAWNLVKSGKRTGFSIHGRGQRTASEM